MKNLEHFKYWLKTKKYNPGTIRNYICDINKYLHFINKHYSKIQNSELFCFSDTAFQNYTLFIINKKNRLRYYTSLAKFSQFAFEKKLTSTNVFRTIRKQTLHHKNTHLDSLLQIYQTNLVHQNKTNATIKNYINDIQQFINWSDPLKNGLK